MSDSDIYKNRERMPVGKKPTKKSSRRRRADSNRSFDDHSRKRRSKNSGLRRLLHLWRKQENEKVFWGSIGVVTVVVLVLIALWQFVILEKVVRVEETNDDTIRIQAAEGQSGRSAAE